jgi:protein TonB
MVASRGFGATSSVALHGAAILTLIVIMRISKDTPLADAAAPLLPRHVVWIPHEAIGGGSDGGGQRATLPPRRVRSIGAEPTSVPVSPQPSPSDSAAEPPDDAPALPAKPMGDATQILAGAIDSSGTSLGPGDAGTGKAATTTQGGLGNSPDQGFGEGAVAGGPGVTTPILIERVPPKYTVEAMHARIQGIALVECVVQIDGTVGDARIMRSLDRRFGLDEEALKAARRWRFKPGLLHGEPVPVVVTIELMFTVR